MKKIVTLIFIISLSVSITACGNQSLQKDKNNSVTTQSSLSQNTSDKAANEPNINPNINPNKKFEGKPVQKQEMDNTTKELKNTMDELESTINSLDSAEDVNTDGI
jgi:uncharacterized lipoprotein YehR (DUF1307 family)